MPKRATIATREYLKQVPLPMHATSYTVITHETVIVNALEQLKLKGFTVQDEKYRTNTSGEVATGRYYLTYGNDPELGMMFAWANSYDKSMRFKCAVGGFVRVSGASIISADFSWGRKHTGTADQEMITMVNTQIINGKIYYDNIVEVKEQMKNTILTPHQMAGFLGEAFFLKQMFNKEQIGVVRDEFIKPSFYYSGDPKSLWSYYNYMLIALKKAHPRTWMDEQRNLHNYVCDYFGIQILPAVTAPVELSDPSITVTVTSSDPITIQAPEPLPGPQHVYVEKAVETAEVKQDKMASSSEDDITPEQQKIIDEAIANLDKVKVKAPTLNLPD